MPLTMKMMVTHFSFFHTDIVACFKDGNFLNFKQVHIKTEMPRWQGELCQVRF